MTSSLYCILYVQVVVPIVAMKAGTDFQTYVDLLVPCPAKISLLEGKLWMK